MIGQLRTLRLHRIEDGTERGGLNHGIRFGAARARAVVDAMNESAASMLNVDGAVRRVEAYTPRTAAWVRAVEPAKVRRIHRSRVGVSERRLA